MYKVSWGCPITLGRSIRVPLALIRKKRREEGIEGVFIDGRPISTGD